VQADNGKEFKGALLILLQKYKIQVVNEPPRSSQTQGLVEQASGVVEIKLKAWKMDNGSTDWANGLFEVTLAMNTQKHSTIGCAPAELLFRERTSYIDWPNSQKRKDLASGVAQEDPTQVPIYTLSPQSQASYRIDIGIQEGNTQITITMRISPEAGSGINLRITPPSQSSSIDEWFDIDAYEPGIRAKTSAPIELDSEPRGSEVEPEVKLVQLGDLVIQKAQKSTRKARARMVLKYSKRHDIQHFGVGDIVSLKVPREDRTSTDNKRLFSDIRRSLLPQT
jgi:hypothetical protein